jgi:hypothetical protein
MSLSRHSPSLGSRSAVRELLLRAAGRGGIYDTQSLSPSVKAKTSTKSQEKAYLKQAPHFVHESCPGKGIRKRDNQAARQTICVP